MNNSEPTIRHKQLSEMFIKMGHALVDEGLNNKDYEVASVGNYMVFMGALIFDREDIALFNELCNMLSARNLVKEITNGNLDFTKLNNIKDISSKDTFQEILKRLKKDLDSNDTALNGE